MHVRKITTEYHNVFLLLWRCYWIIFHYSNQSYYLKKSVFYLVCVCQEYKTNAKHRFSLKKCKFDLSNSQKTTTKPNHYYVHFSDKTF